MLFAFEHAVQPEHDERHGEQLPHVQEHSFLEGFLVLLRVFNEDAAREDEEEAEAEEEACADLLRVATVEKPVDAEEDGIADGFVELSGMSWKHIDLLEDETLSKLLTRRYVDEAKWETIMAEMGYCHAHVFRLQDEAIKKLDQILKDETK